MAQVEVKALTPHRSGGTFYAVGEKYEDEAQRAKEKAARGLVEIVGGAKAVAPAENKADAPGANKAAAPKRRKRKKK